ncbi:calcium/sodium antiporter [Minwuia thermotolerans]|uniref:Sodium:proton exchanger n=1 Tax=Minwuia thermotolerans TaxID=2056226 RepID=A0A2M9FWL8_9PROT|nr:calcium/sodium antiporter [Minwuia thermotolerans]PJK27829.1 sodium:proton exchanger [Minwuia thermotolerans]
MMYLMVAAGLILLLLGGEALVRAAVTLADRLGVSKLIIGLTVVAFGTSAPELLVCVQAVLEDAPAIAIGNIVGSNIANILLVVGAPALIAPFYCAKSTMKREGTAMLGATLILIAFMALDSLRVWSGALLFALLLLFLYTAYRSARRSSAGSYAEEVEELSEGVPRSGVAIAALLVLGLAGLVAGSGLLVDGAREIALAAGLSETVIGITLVALGTSLPELATSIVAAMRRHGDVAIGNVIGSNLFNILGILGITAMVAPIPVPPQIMLFDVWVMLACAVVLFPLAFARLPVGRAAGAVFLLGYGAYVWAQFAGLSGMPIDKMAGG